jgi:tetratricopeptide (TPR) repeat protein
MIAHIQNDFEEAITRYKEEYGIYHAHQQERPALAFNLGQALVQRAEYDEAESFFRRALSLTQKMYGETHVFYAHCLRGLGSFLFDSRGNADAAEPLLRQSLALMTQTVGETHVSFRQATSVLVDLLKERGRLEEAEARARAGLASAVAKLGDRDSQTVAYRSDLAGVLVARGKLDDAEALLASNPVPDAATPDLESARLLIELGRLRRSQDRHQDALAHFNEALQMRQQLLPAHHLLVAAAQLEVGRSLMDARRYADAEPHLRDGLATRRRHLGATHPRTIESRNALAVLYRQWGKPEKIQELGRTTAG